MTVTSARSTGAPSTRERILRGAATALAQEGLGSCTVQHMLKTAGVSRRTWYQHFRSREDVLLVLYSEVADALVTAVRWGAASTEDPARRLFAAIDAYFEFQEQGGTLLTLLQAEAIRPDSMLAERRERTLDELVAFIDGEVERDTGFRLDPLVYRSLFLGMDGLVIHLRSAGAFGTAERQRVGRLMRPIFLQVLAAGEFLPARPEEGLQ